jgi:hypothetical protein
MNSLPAGRSHINRIINLALTLVLVSSLIAGFSLQKHYIATAFSTATIDGCSLFPIDNVWNRDISTLSVDRNSANYIASIGTTGHVHADFGAGLYGGGPIGLPYIVVPGNQPYVPVSFNYADESDPGPYPIPPNAPIEGGPQSSDDRHVIVIDSGICKLYEMFASYPQSNGSWNVGSGAVWNLNSNALRPSSWTSADAAGLPILPGLVRYDEVASGVINHALRFTVNSTQRAFLWPARHYASSSTNPNLPPMGLRLRLKANVDISSYSPTNQVILTALKHYGMFVADNGSSWFISGAPDNRWNNDDLQALGAIPGSDFEVVDESSLQVSPNSGQAAGSTAVTSTPTKVPTVMHSPTAISTGTRAPTAAVTPEPFELINRKSSSATTYNAGGGGPGSILPLAIGSVAILLTITGLVSGIIWTRRKSEKRF